LDRTAHKDQWERQDSPEPLAALEMQDRQEILALREYRDRQVNQVTMDLVVSKVRKGQLD